MPFPKRFTAIHQTCLFLSLAGVLAIAQADEKFPQRIVGEIGLGVYSSSVDIKGDSGHPSVLPYVFFDYDRLFARIDTFGVKTARMGRGYLEVAGRASRDAYAIDLPGLRGRRSRRDSIPLGLGSLQETSAADIFVNLFHDMGKSGGNIFQLTYAAEIDLPSIAFYPQVELEYLSRDYVRYYYGLTAEEALSGVAYQPGGSLNKSVGLMTELKLGGHWRLNLNVNRSWQGGAVSESPLAAGKHQDSGFLALSYEFE